MEEIDIMENPKNIVARAVWEVKLLLETGNDAIIPLSLLRDIYFDQYTDPTAWWFDYETGMVTFPRNGKDVTYIIFKVTDRTYTELSVGE